MTVTAIIRVPLADDNPHIATGAAGDVSYARLLHPYTNP
jgi:hypothetical protein